MKKAIIALISLLIFCIVFPSTVSAESAGSHYKPRLTAPTSDNAYYNSKLNRYSQTGYGMPNCVAYAYGRVYEMNGKAPKITHGNAGEWWSINKQGGYYKYGSKPKVGAVVVWSNHVAVVEQIHKDGSITISESHYGGTYFDTKTVTDYTYHYGQTFYGFIYTYQGSAKKKSKPKQYTAAKTAVTAPEEQEQVFRMLEIDDSKAATQEIVQNDKLLQASAASHSTKKADTEKRAAAQKAAMQTAEKSAAAQHLKRIYTRSTLWVLFFYTNKNKKTADGSYP